MLDNVDFGSGTSFSTGTNCFDTSAVEFNNGGFTFDTNGVTFPETGYYIIGASLYYQAATAGSSNDRICPEMKFYNHTQDANLNGTNGSVAAMGYCRNLSNSGNSGPRNSSSMITQIVSLTANDKIKIRMKRGADSGIEADIESDSCMWGIKLQ
tara:strand:+ start:1081 stop:1542 length:462 start_codon:yes stop_codon:yes gene_type:complete